MLEEGDQKFLFECPLGIQVTMLSRQLDKQSEAKEKDWARGTNGGIVSAEMVFSIRGEDEVNHRVSLEWGQEVLSTLTFLRRRMQ